MGVSDSCEQARHQRQLMRESFVTDGAELGATTVAAVIRLLRSRREKPSGYVPGQQK